MDNKSDVKAIMARFQAGNSSMEGAPVIRPKPPVQPTLSSGPVIPTKKPTLETSLSGGATPTSTATKPNFVKHTVNTARSAPDMHDPPKVKAFGTRFENTQDNNKGNFKVPVKPKPPDSCQDSETSKVPFQKVPLQKPPSSIMPNDSKVMSSKPLAPVAKPPWIKEDNSSSSTPSQPKMPSAPKPKSTAMAMLRHQPEESSTMDPAPRPSSVSQVKQSSFHSKNSFNKPDEGVKEGPKVSSANESVSKPIAPHKPNFPRKASGPTVNDDPSAPKKKPLTNSYALGSAPSKPNRPPNVNLEKYKMGSGAATDSPGPKIAGPPPPPASHPSIQAPPPLPSQPLPPSLPPRPSGALIQDENYDDVESLRLSSGGQKIEGSGSDGEIYEDLDDSRSAAEISQPQKKQDKELKIQKDREKKEKDAIKKFKITPPLQVIHQVKAKSDCKGGKHDLAIKKGESVDIIRITDNPEGKWLGRSQDGSFGYVKTDMVEIDFSVLKNQGLSLPHNLDNEEVYDDVEAMDDQGNMNSQRVVLPPPPDDDVYDDIPDSNPNPISIGDPKPLLKPRYFLDMLKSSVERRKSQIQNNDIPPPPQFTPEGNKDIPQDIYDDVDSFPGTQSPSSIPQMKSKMSKVHEDPKKQKKFEKEEKEFRKKFKYDGEIQVLHQAIIGTTKKGSGKDLAVQAGETVDVISKSDPDKFICRNKEGKFGYVPASNIQLDEEVYDDIGDDCIYDND